ncbi:GntR family transcriptional regulator [Cytobacillus massiliigabonensis]|uniref:GntR family transcriptional regulator n=1 Tax=Cytobacillus massiliigabonensis TaxID=1871011 RepID=UPI000C82127E|nr:GntR family transcriptional regulator [Cytobacillus massiliigabonensis]
MQIIISNYLKEPIYEQISNQIKSLILNGDLSEGTLLPSIRQLAKNIQVSVITTKRAYEVLEKEGFIYTVVGKGSYVSEQNTEIIKELKLKDIEEKLIETIESCKLIGVSSQELKEMINLLFEEE